MKRCLAVLLALCLAVSGLTGCGPKRVEEGLEFLESGDYRRAIKKFKESIDNDKDLGEAYRGIGIAEWELGEYEAARNAFVSALENGAKKTGTLYNFLGNCEMQLNNPKAALNYYNLGIASEDCSEEMLQEMRFNEIAAFEQCGEWENAKTKAAAYIEAYPEDPRAVKEAAFLETQQR